MVLVVVLVVALSLLEWSSLQMCCGIFGPTSPLNLLVHLSVPLLAKMASILLATTLTRQVLLLKFALIVAVLSVTVLHHRVFVLVLALMVLVLLVTMLQHRVRLLALRVSVLLVMRHRRMPVLLLALVVSLLLVTLQHRMMMLSRLGVVAAHVDQDVLHGLLDVGVQHKCRRGLH